MGLYEVQWQMDGIATVEADDKAEASRIVTDSLENMDTSMFEQFDVTRTDITNVDES